MNKSTIILLLSIILASCTTSKDKKSVNDDLGAANKTESSERVEFNTLVKGTGSPTVIFESGLGTPLNNWGNIQEAISANYKTIAYDRRGIGGSPATDDPRTIDNLVRDLDLLIKQEGIEGPIVLVGHSLGGHIVRKYQELFPANVVGLFLVDPTNEYIYDEVFDQMSPEAADSLKAQWDNNFSEQPVGVSNEWKEVYNIDEIMRKCPLPKNIPVTILASYQPSTFLTSKNAEIKKTHFENWKNNRPNVRILNTMNSGHYIHLGEPAWVITELEAYLHDLK